MPLATINYFFEGDFEFIMKAIEMFQEFDKFIEDTHHFTKEFTDFFIK